MAVKYSQPHWVRCEGPVVSYLVNSTDSDIGAEEKGRTTTMDESIDAASLGTQLLQSGNNSSSSSSCYVRVRNHLAFQSQPTRCVDGAIL